MTTTSIMEEWRRILIIWFSPTLLNNISTRCRISKDSRTVMSPRKTTRKISSKIWTVSSNKLRERVPTIITFTRRTSWTTSPLWTTPPPKKNQSKNRSKNERKRTKLSHNSSSYSNLDNNFKYDYGGSSKSGSKFSYLNSSRKSNEYQYKAYIQPRAKF